MGPDSISTLIALLVGLAVLALAGAGYGFLLRRTPTARRVDHLSGVHEEGQGTDLKARLAPAVNPVFRRLAELAKPKQDWQVSRIRKELVTAGFRSKGALNVFLGAKVLSLVVLPPLILLSPLPDRVTPLTLSGAMVGAACAGFLLPNYYLAIRRRKRVDLINRELPEVLDLMVLAVEAGLGLDAALKRVSKELAVSARTMAEELAIVSLELKAGVQRNRALRNLADRCGVDDVSNLVAMLNQADRFGVSVGRSLRVHSDSVRTKRRQQAEEKAAKIPLKLLFPVLLLIFPAIMAIMVGPALIQVSENLFR